MNIRLNRFFTSGWKFDELDLELKSRYQMVNIGLLLSSLSLLYAIVVNAARETPSFIPIEIVLILANTTFFFLLRANKKYFEYITTLMTAQFTFFFIFMVYVSEPSQLKHIWLFTYPIILFYFQGTRRGYYWFTLLILLLIVAPIQSFVEVSYSLHQVTYIAFALTIVQIVIHFYQKKMKEATKLILNQQDKLKLKIEELEKKDEILSLQSKQAVMGEMISMIAHQWRQPLSTITLQISNYQIEQLLLNSKEKKIDKTLSEISDTIIYLSETIDDFQTYFSPNKDISKVSMKELIQKIESFIHPRINGEKIDLKIISDKKLVLEVYLNELIQVMLNMLNNAIDTLIENRPQDATILLNVVDLGKEIEISVEDNSIGISDENLPYLFEPYFSTKGKNGTGLGLYMSQMIIEKQFNGTISVETSPKGSKFTLTIPKSV